MVEQAQDLSKLGQIRRMVDWEWISPVAIGLGNKPLVMRCYETSDGRLYRVDTLDLWIPDGEYRFRGEVRRTLGAGGRLA